MAIIGRNLGRLLGQRFISVCYTASYCQN